MKRLVSVSRAVVLGGLLLLFCIVVHSEKASAQIPNGEFGSNIYLWYTMLSNNPNNDLPGTAMWSSLYSGSAHLYVEGAPASVALLTYTTQVITAGVRIGARVTHDDYGATNTVFALQIGGDNPSYNDRLQSQQEPVGTHDYVLTASRTYPIGTPIHFGLTTWPGTNNSYVQYVRAPLGVVDDGRPEQSMLNKTFSLKAMPNPSGAGGITLGVNLPVESKLNISIYDIQGRSIAKINSGRYKAGEQSIRWTGRGNDGQKLPAGVYFLRATAGDFTATEKVVITR